MVDNRSSAQSPVDASPLRFLGTVWRGLSLSAIAVASGRALHLLFILALLPLALDLPSVSGAHLHLAFARAIPAAAVTTAAVALIAAAPLVLAALVFPGIGRGRAAGTAPISNASEPPKVSDSTPGAVGGSGKGEARQEDRTLEVLRGHVCWTSPPGRRRSRPARLRPPRQQQAKLHSRPRSRTSGGCTDAGPGVSGLSRK